MQMNGTIIILYEYLFVGSGSQSGRIRLTLMLTLYCYCPLNLVIAMLTMKTVSIFLPLIKHVVRHVLIMILYCPIAECRL